MLKLKKISPAKNAYSYPLLIKSLLKNALTLKPDKEIVYKNLVRYNYIELNKRICRYANMLKRIGLQGGTAVGIIDYDSHRYLESYFAIPMTGNVIHTVNWRLSPQQALYTINHAEDEVLIVNKDFLPFIEGIKDQFTTVKKIILINEDNKQDFQTSIEFIGEYEDLLSIESNEYDFPDFEDDAVASIFYTSGTTGDPKGIHYTHKHLVLQALTVAVHQGLCNAGGRFSATDVYLPLTPMFHILAWTLPYVATMLGLKQVYTGKFEINSFLQIFKEEKPTLSHCVPTIMNMILNHPLSQEIDFRNWKTLVGGSAIPEELVRQALERGVDIITVYGMSESGPLISNSYITDEQLDNDLEWQIKARIRTGKPPVFVDLRVVDQYNNDVPKDDHAVGEIVARGPSFTTGYFKEEEKSEELWRDGYLHTEDLGTILPSKNILVCDRMKDVIKTGGEWISSLLLENLIAQYQGVSEVAVVAISDPKWIERPYAVIVPKSGFQLKKEKIQSFLEQFIETDLINKWAIPELIDFVEVIPKTSVGKYDKKRIRQELQDKMVIK